MRLVLMGAPGAGKGTQAELLARTFGIPHISTGEMFRSAVREGTPMGLVAKTYMESGLLVPDDVTIGIVKERLSRPDTVKGFILDGFPRNVCQADALHAMLDEMGAPLDCALNIDVPRDALIRRTAGRRVCECGASYHIEFGPPKLVKDQCDACGRALVQRKDDHPDVVEERLCTYEGATKPLIEYYRRKGLLVEIDGSGSAAQVFAAVVSILEMSK